MCPCHVSLEAQVAQLGIWPGLDYPIGTVGTVPRDYEKFEAYEKFGTYEKFGIYEKFRTLENSKSK